MLGGNRRYGSIKRGRRTGSAALATFNRVVLGSGVSALSQNCYLTLSKSPNLTVPLLICKMGIMCFED